MAAAATMQVDLRGAQDSRVQRTHGHEPAAEGLQGPECLVNARRTQPALAEAAEKPRDRCVIERGKVGADVGIELPEPCTVDTHSSLGATADLFTPRRGLRAIAQNLGEPLLYALLPGGSGCALSLYYQDLARPEGFEPPTRCLEGSCSFP